MNNNELREAIELAGGEYPAKATKPQLQEIYESLDIPSDLDDELEDDELESDDTDDELEDEIDDTEDLAGEDEDDDEVTDEPELTDDGRVELRRPLEDVSTRGDWRDPFSGKRVHHLQDVCRANGARREGNEVSLLVLPKDLDKYA